MEKSGTIKQSYLVEGMTCSGCERTVERIIGNLDGVKSSKADLGSATVSVEYDSSKVDVDKIKSAVGSVGYKIIGERRAHGQRQGSDEAVS